MKKRIRKKKHLGEFKEFGFTIAFTTQDLTLAQEDAFWDRWILNVEASGLAYGGACGPGDWDGFITLAERGSATDGHRAVIEKWLSSEAVVTKHEVGALVDAWQ